VSRDSVRSRVLVRSSDAIDRCPDCSRAAFRSRLGLWGRRWKPLRFSCASGARRSSMSMMIRPTSEMQMMISITQSWLRSAGRPKGGIGDISARYAEGWRMLEAQKVFPTKAHPIWQKSTFGQRNNKIIFARAENFALVELSLEDALGEPPRSRLVSRRPSSSVF